QQQGSEDDANHFPVVHLLRLLEKPLYYSHGNAITELLMQLLSTITKPLSGMVRRSKQQQGDSASSTAAPAASSASLAASSSSAPSSSAAGGSSAFQLPSIPAHALRAIVNVLAAGECTSRTFQHTLSLIQNLSCINGVLTVITNELVKRATELSGFVCKEISMLLSVLETLPTPKTDQQRQAQMRQGQGQGQSGSSDSRTSTPLNAAEDNGTTASIEVSAEVLDKVRDITLSKFSPARSHQARLLRLLMAIDYISTTVAKRLEERQQQKQKDKKPSDGQEPMDVDSKSPTAAASADDAVPAELLHLRSLALGHDAQFLPLWEAASSCLQYTSTSPELVHVATVLLPLIESFMVIFKPIV
ncbi:E3 ubiquitin-protein ligase tom1, partial [Coemansia asiatica]